MVSNGEQRIEFICNVYLLKIVRLITQSTRGSTNSSCVDCTVLHTVAVQRQKLIYWFFQFCQGVSVWVKYAYVGMCIWQSSYTCVNEKSKVKCIKSDWMLMLCVWVWCTRNVYVLPLMATTHIGWQSTQLTRTVNEWTNKTVANSKSCWCGCCWCWVLVASTSKCRHGIVIKIHTIFYVVLKVK